MEEVQRKPIGSPPKIVFVLRTPKPQPPPTRTVLPDFSASGWLAGSSPPGTRSQQLLFPRFAILVACATDSPPGGSES